MDTDTLQLNPEDRVLTLLCLLGEDASGMVLERLDPQMMATFKSRLKGMSTSEIPVRRQKQVLDEFDRFFRFAVASRPRLRLHSEGDEDGDALPEPLPAYKPSGDPLIDLERMNPHQLASTFNEEQPRTVALMMKVVTAGRAAQILNLLDDSRREAVVREMSRDPRAPEIILRRIASTTVERALQFSPNPPKNDDPVQRLVDVLRATDKSKRRQILRTIEDQDPEKASLVNQSLYQFDDLKGLGDSQIQQVLARVDSSTLSTAIFGAEEAIIEKIMSNLSRRARATLQEELSFRKNVPASQLQAARQLVVQAIAEADQEPE